MSPLKGTIIFRIKELREARGLSQWKLAELLGVTRQQAQQYEKGVTDIPLSKLAKLAEVLGVRVQDLFWIKTDETPEPEAVFMMLSGKDLVLMKFWHAIKDLKLRDAIFEVFRMMAVG